jgi:hypothetical protein
VFGGDIIGNRAAPVDRCVERFWLPRGADDVKYRRLLERSDHRGRVDSSLHSGYEAGRFEVILHEDEPLVTVLVFAQ